MRFLRDLALVALSTTISVTAAARCEVPQGSRIQTIGFRVQQSPFGSAMPNLDYLPVLLFNPKVQKELDLSPAVVQQEQSLIIEMGMKMLPLAQTGNSSAQNRKQMIHAYEELEGRTIAPLNFAQRSRLHELTLQFYGPMALEMPSVANKLGLSPNQKTKIAEIVSENGRSMQGGVPKGNGGNMASQLGSMSKRMEAARAVAQHKLDKVLTPAQRAKWTALQGRPLPGITSFGGLGGP